MNHQDHEKLQVAEAAFAKIQTKAFIPCGAVSEWQRELEDRTEKTQRLREARLARDGNSSMKDRVSARKA